MLYFLSIGFILLFSPISAEIDNLPWAFYIPESYSVIAKTNGDNEAIIIAPKNFDIENLESTSEFSQPFILGIKMQFLNSFNEDMEKMLSEVEKQFAKGFETKFSKWGSYPIVAIKMSVGLDECYLAYASLEDADKNGIMFTFAYPRKKEFGNGNKPNKDNLKFWNDFLTKTTKLENPTAVVIPKLN